MTPPALQVVQAPAREPDSLLTIKEAHRYLLERHAATFSVSWLYREAGVTVPCVRPKPRMLRFRKSDLDKWIANLPASGGAR